MALLGLRDPKAAINKPKLRRVTVRPDRQAETVRPDHQATVRPDRQATACPDPLYIVVLRASALHRQVTARPDLCHYIVVLRTSALRLQVIARPDPK